MLNLDIEAGNAKPVRPGAEQPCLGWDVEQRQMYMFQLLHGGEDPLKHRRVWCGGGWGARKGKDGLEGFAATTGSCLRGQEECGGFCLGVGLLCGLYCLGPGVKLCRTERG